MKRDKLEGVGRESVVALIDEAIVKGWKEIEVSATPVLSRAIWFEGEMRGVSVRGYSPTPADENELHAMRQKGLLPQRVLSSTVALFYAQKVIPELERKIEKESRKLQAGAYKTPKSRVDAMDRIEDFHEMLGRSRVLEERFRQAGSKPVEVQAVYLDGVLRYEPVERAKRQIGHER